MRRHRSACATTPVLERLEGRTLLSGGSTSTRGRGGPPANRVSHASEVERADADLDGLTLDQRGRFAISTGGSHQSARRLGGSRAAVRAVSVRSGKTAARVVPEYPLLGRLAQWVPKPTLKDPNAGSFQKVAPGSIGANNSATADNVYVIAHGWMPGYLAWVRKLQQANPSKPPLSWQTWQGSGPKPAAGASTTWLFQPSSTNGLQTNFQISDAGLAQKILKADPHATVLAYSWIDESATSPDVDAAGIPTKGYQSEAYTTMNGMRMAEAIMKALAPNYAQGLGKVHLIGHSHGARVAAVAALALQQAAATNPRFDVVRQLTLLDSPESIGTSVVDAANFDWFYLAQLSLVHPVALPGNVVSGNPGEVTGLTDFSGLSIGMGVTGPGIPAGTTIATINPGAGNVVLSARMTVSSPGPVQVGFWNWGKDNIFVDNYISLFDEPLDNYDVVDSHLNISQALTNVVDVQLNPALLFQLYPDLGKAFALMHEYAAAWYAGSAVTQGTSQQVGLLWSPLIAGASLPPPAPSLSSQGQPTTMGTQFILTPGSPASPDYPTFSDALLDPAQPSKNSTKTRNPGPVSSVTLSDAPKRTSQFIGTVDVPGGSAGFSFDYTFAQANDRAQLQISINNQPHFAMTGSVAKSSILPGSGHLTATFGVGMNRGTVPIKIELVKPAGVRGRSGASTAVTLGHFSTFTG